MLVPYTFKAVVVSVVSPLSCVSMNTNVLDSPFCCSAGDADAVVESVSLFSFYVHVNSLKFCNHEENKDDNQIALRQKQIFIMEAPEKILKASTDPHPGPVF